MKKILFLLLLSITTRLYADDTASLQASINAGNYTAPAGHSVYNVTSLNMTHNFNLNGNKLNCTGTSGGCVIFPAGVKHKKFSNGEIYGQTDISNSSGPYGVRWLADSDTVANVRVHNFPAYGMLAGQVNGVVILNCRVYDTGYIGVFIINSSAPSKGPVCMADTFDRSMLPAAGPHGVTQGCLQIKGAAGDTVSGSVVTNCVFKAPFKPADNTAECFEIRYAANSVIANNQFNGGSIGLSVVDSRAITANANTFINQALEALEYANAQNGFIENNSISNQVKHGILFDTNATGNTIINNNIRGCPSPGYCIQFSTGSNNNSVIGCTLITAYRAVNLAGTNNITFYNNNFKGGQIAILLDSSTGGVRLYGGTIAGFSTKAVAVFSASATVTDNILMNGVILSGTPGGLQATLSGGATLGGNVRVN